MEFYVVGADQKKTAHRKPEWHQYRHGTILRVDTQREAVETCVNYRSPEEFCPQEDPSIQFKAATVKGDKCYACTGTEIIVYKFPEFRQENHISLPGFNDIHHVTVNDYDNLIVANTGLDMVIELTADGRVLREWTTLEDERPWQRFSRDVDYRKVPSTKPHRSHPNYVFCLDDEIWTTRFVQRDAICLSRPGTRIEIGAEGPHDGIVDNDAIYFTTVDGHVIEVDRESLKVRQAVNLNALHEHALPLGWCRGIAVLEPNVVLVGFSQLRPTRWKSNLEWLDKEWKRLRGRKLNHRYSDLSSTAQICMYNLRSKKLLWKFPVGKYGLSAVFSIHPAPTKGIGMRAA